MDNDYSLAAGGSVRWLTPSGRRLCALLLGLMAVLAGAPRAAADIVADPLDRGAADASGSVGRSPNLRPGSAPILDFSAWPNAVIEVDIAAQAHCYNILGDSTIRVDTRLGTLHEIEHRHYGEGTAIADGLSGDGTTRLATRSGRFSRHAYEIVGTQLNFVYVASGCASWVRFNRADYWVFDQYNHAPTFGVLPTLDDAPEDAAYSVTLASDTALDPAGEAITYSVAGLPTWLSFDPASRVLSGTPAQEDVGSVALTLRATESGGRFVEAPLNFDVLEVNDNAPVFTSPASAVADENALDTAYVAGASDADTGDAVVFSIVGGADAARFSVDAGSGVLSWVESQNFEAPGDADGDGVYQLTLRAADVLDQRAELDLALRLGDVNEAPQLAGQSLSVAEFAPLGTAVGGLVAADPEGDSLNWQLLSPGTPFALSGDGQLRLQSALDYESVASYSLQVGVSDGEFSRTAQLAVAVIDQSEDPVQRLLDALPATLSDYEALGLAALRPTAVDYYNRALGAAAPATVGEVQALIDEANTLADILERSGSGIGEAAPDATAPLLVWLERLGIAPLAGDAGALYERRIAGEQPEPQTTAELQRLVDDVNAVLAVASAAQLVVERGDDAVLLRQRLLELQPALVLVDAVLPALAGQLLDRRGDFVDSAALTQWVADYLAAAAAKPVVSLAVQQAGRRVNALRAGGGRVSVVAVISNPDPVHEALFDWSASGAMALAAAVGPLATEALTLDAEALPGRGQLRLALTVTRQGATARAELSLPLVGVEVDAASLVDSDGDGVADRHSVAGAGAAQALQLQREAADSVMLAVAGSHLRLGEAARALQLNQAQLSLSQLQSHVGDRGSLSPQASWPEALDSQGATIVDFEVSQLAHAGAAAQLVLPLRQPLPAGAQYLKYHPATGWHRFVEDSLNRLDSATSAGPCPAVDASDWRRGLVAGANCVRLTVEDGGPNDADTLQLDGQPAADGGVNGAVIDPGAIAYPRSDAVVIQSGIGTWSWIGLAALWLLGRRRRAGQG